MRIADFGLRISSAENDLLIPDYSQMVHRRGAENAEVTQRIGLKLGV